MTFETLSIKVKTSGANKDYNAKLVTYVPDITLENLPKREAVVICPGGGYHFLAPREAEPIALEFASRGMCAFVLYYSVSPAIYPQAVCEAAEAVKIVRDNAEKWNINPNKIAICGFSAGGHLAASLGVYYHTKDVLDNLNCTEDEVKPNAMILSYPVITSGEKAHRGSFNNLLGERYDELVEYTSLENRVTEKAPPAFIWHTITDQAVPVENSIYMFSALKNAGVNAEMHIFPNGEHGLSLANELVGCANPQAERWLDMAVDYIKNL